MTKRCLIAVFVLAALGFAARDASAQTRPIVFMNANIIPMDARPILSGYTILVLEGRILQLGPSARTPVRQDSVLIEARDKYLVPGFSAEFGGIEVGKPADFVIVDANPLESIDNLQKRFGIMVQGRWVTEEDLQKRVQEATAK